MGKKLKDKNKWSNHQKLFLFVVKVVCFLSFEVHKNMNVENTIEKLQIVIKEKETQNCEHKRRHEEEAELLKKIEA